MASFKSEVRKPPQVTQYRLWRAQKHYRLHLKIPTEVNFQEEIVRLKLRDSHSLQMLKFGGQF